jgi:hypothetical protein
MNSKDLARYLVLGGVVAGLSAGTQLRANTVNLNDLSKNATQMADSNKKSSDKAADAKHACKGQNACGGKGNCKSGDKGCAGKNSCKGKGGCASKEYRHSCKGQNACKGQGPDGKNDCKGHGACAVPPAPPATAS